MSSYLVVALVALFALSIKALVLSKAVTRTNLNSAFVVLALCMIAMNAAEFSTGVVLAYRPDEVLYYFYAVLACLFVFPVAMLRLVAVATQNRFANVFTAIAAIYSAALLVLLFSGLLVKGYEVVTYSIISIPGPFYDLFSLYAPFVLGTPVAMLLFGLRSQNKGIARRSKIMLLAIAPICVLGLGVTSLKAMGFDATTAFSMPIATTLFLWILMLDEKDEFVTLQVKWRVLWKLSRKMNNLNMSEWRDALEKEMVKEVLQSEKYNVREAAKVTHTNHITFYRRMAKYGIRENT